MRAREIPVPRDFSIRVRCEGLKMAARAMLREVVWAAQGWGERLKQWVLGHTTITVGASKTFLALRNGGAAVRRMKGDEALTTLKQRGEDIDRGIGLRRVPGCAKIADASSPKEYLGSIRGEIRRALAPRGADGKKEKKPNDQELGKRRKEEMKRNAEEEETRTLEERAEEATSGEDSGAAPEAAGPGDPAARPSPLPDFFPMSNRVHAQLSTANPKKVGVRKEEWDAFRDQFADVERVVQDASGDNSAGRRGPDPRRSSTRDPKPRGKRVGSQVNCADDKSPKEGWLLETPPYTATVLAAALSSGWALMKGVDLDTAEFAAKGWYLDGLPVGFRRFVGQAVRGGSRIIPYLYSNFKAKCFFWGTRRWGRKPARIRSNPAHGK